MELEYHQLDLRYEALRLRRRERERRLLADLSERGQQVPVVVVGLEGEAQRYVLIDGFARTRALRRLGSDTVRATVWELCEPEALLLSLELTQFEGHCTLLGEGVRDAKDTTAVCGGIQVPDGRAGSSRA